MEEVSFKSNRENFNKELHGIKCNTFRKIDIMDMRFPKLGKMQKTKEYGIIEITCDNSCFKRQIKDITTWDGYMIISWDNPDIKKKVERFKEEYLKLGTRVLNNKSDQDVLDLIDKLFNGK